MSELFKCLCFMERLSFSTRDHNASGVDPGCFMIYNCFQSHGFITHKCRLLLRAVSFTYCTSEVTLTLASRLRMQLSLSDRTRANVTFTILAFMKVTGEQGGGKISVTTHSLSLSHNHTQKYNPTNSLTERKKTV